MVGLGLLSFLFTFACVPFVCLSVCVAQTVLSLLLKSNFLVSPLSLLFVRSVFLLLLFKGMEICEKSYYNKGINLHRLLKQSLFNVDRSYREERITEELSLEEEPVLLTEQTDRNLFHMAVYSAHLPTIERLLELGADIHVKDGKGNT
jgi:hypothetical protein